MSVLERTVTWTANDLAMGVRRAHAAMSALEQQLNDADAKLGDGDTGGMLARVLSQMDKVDLSTSTDIGDAFARLAKAAVSATGSSLGTLFATALLTIAKNKKGEAGLEPSELSGLLAQCRDAMMARGGAELGDKTVLDSLNAVVVALEADPSGDVPAIARSASWQALDRFRDQPNKRGRARMFGETTIGLDDPGMLAFAELTSAVTAE